MNNNNLTNNELGKDASQVLSQRLTDFNHLLISKGLAPGPRELLDAHTIAANGYLQDSEYFRLALKSSYCHSQQHWQAFDVLFEEFWQPEFTADSQSQGDATGESAGAANTESDSRLVGFAGTSSQKTEAEFAGAGDYKAISLADFRFVFNAEEMLAIENMVDELARRSRHAYLRRKRPARNGSLLDMRRSLARSPRYDGVVADLRYLKRRQKPHRFILLLDVSQSMEVYSKLFLRYARKLASVFRQSHIFAFNTELVQLPSDQADLSEADFEDRLNAQSQWLGGTKIAKSLARFNDSYAEHLMNSQTTVVVFSDGCDTEPPGNLAREAKRIQLRARRFIWVNPLLGRFSYSEKDPYMDPIVPYVDRYRSAHNLHTLGLLGREFLY